MEIAYGFFLQRRVEVRAEMKFILLVCMEPQASCDLRSRELKCLDLFPDNP